LRTKPDRFSWRSIVSTRSTMVKKPTEPKPKDVLFISTGTRCVLVFHFSTPSLEKLFVPPETETTTSSFEKPDLATIDDDLVAFMNIVSLSVQVYALRCWFPWLPHCDSDCRTNRHSVGSRSIASGLEARFSPMQPTFFWNRVRVPFYMMACSGVIIGRESTVSITYDSQARRAQLRSKLRAASIARKNNAERRSVFIEPVDLE
jgi:hypothetical protein